MWSCPFFCSFNRFLVFPPLPHPDSPCTKPCSRCLGFSSGFNRLNLHPLCATHTHTQSNIFSALLCALGVCPLPDFKSLTFFLLVRVWPMEGVAGNRNLRGERSQSISSSCSQVCGPWTLAMTDCILLDHEPLLGNRSSMAPAVTGICNTFLSSCSYSSKCGNLFLPLPVCGYLSIPCWLISHSVSIPWIKVP